VPNEDDEAKNALKHIADAVQKIEDLLAALPGDIAKDLRTKLGTVRGVLLEHRNPALVLVGRRGAGKSSLVNALFGAKVAEVGHVTAQTGRGKWFDFTNPQGTMSILDTRGVQEGSAPAEGDDAAAPLESILFELARKAPDAVVYVVKAADVDAAVDRDLEALEAIANEVERKHRARPPIVCAVTHCDVLEPKATKLHDGEREPPRDREEKLRHVHAAERAIDAKLRARAPLAPQLKATVGISSYMSWRDDGTLRADERWQIADLSRELFKLMPDAGRGAFVRIARVKALEEDLADSLSKAIAMLCAAIGVIPIPVADIIPITSLQVALVMGIAWISGRELEAKAAGEFLGALGVNVGAGFAFREAARALLKLVPTGGAVVSGGIAFAGTLAIGAAAKSYFIRGEPIDQVKKVFAIVKKKANKDG
jgi:predicted GTPase/uncharacterized protein (DUF697 family)